jgi:hypothetical protein
MIFPGSVDGPDIKNLFLMSISESLIGEGQRTKNDQENSKPGDWFHLHSLPERDSAELSQDNQTKSDGMLSARVSCILLHQHRRRNEETILYHRTHIHILRLHLLLPAITALWIMGGLEAVTRFDYGHFCRAARENRSWRDQLQLVKGRQYALPADIVLLRLDRSR